MYSLTTTHSPLLTLVLSSPTMKADVQLHRSAWSVFFTIFTVLIVTTLMLPGVLGMQSFTQWGGMYDDHWCTADLYSENPNGAPADRLRHEYVAVGDGVAPRVYSVPSHNPQTCLMWLKMLCGKPSKEGWIIRWVRPVFQKNPYLDPQNACDVPTDTSLEWFRL